MYQVVKRDGQIAEFDIHKIGSAIQKAFEAAGNPGEARRALEAAMAEGNWIDFEFFPLRDVVWESPAEGIDFDYWINLANRALAAERGGETALAESLNRRIHHFRSHLEAEGRDAAWLEA